MTQNTKDELIFKIKCEDKLPLFLTINNNIYKLHANKLLSGRYRISYGEFNRDFYNWNNKLIDLFYEIVDVIPTEKENEEDRIFKSLIYKITVNDIIDDALDKLKLFETK